MIFPIIISIMALGEQIHLDPRNVHLVCQMHILMSFMFPPGCLRALHSFPPKQNLFNIYLYLLIMHSSLLTYYFRYSSFPVVVS